MRRLVGGIFKEGVFWLLLIVGMLVVLAPDNGYAQLRDIDGKIEEIQRRVDKEVQRLRTLRKEQSLLEKDLAVAEQEIDKLRQQENDLSVQLDRIAGGISKADTAIADIDKKKQELQLLSARRIRAIYMVSTSSTLDELVFKGNSADFTRNAYFAGRIRKHDEHVMHDYLRLLKQERSQRASLMSFQRQQEQVQQKIRKGRQERERSIARRQKALQELKKKEPEVAARVTELRAQALRLETVVASITGGGISSAEDVKGSDRSPQQEIPGPEAFDGRGLAPLKKSLKPPVDGAIVKKFGKMKHKEFKDFVFHKGIEYVSSARSHVRAVADGVVMHKGRMPGYGTILIIDHGQRYYSLYGKVSETLVEKGQQVGAGASIATLKKSSEEGYRLYFEIRKEGRPVNPLDYLR